MLNRRKRTNLEQLTYSLETVSQSLAIALETKAEIEERIEGYQAEIESLKSHIQAELSNQ